MTHPLQELPCPPSWFVGTDPSPTAGLAKKLMKESMDDEDDELKNWAVLQRVKVAELVRVGKKSKKNWCNLYAVAGCCYKLSSETKRSHNCLLRYIRNGGYEMNNKAWCMKA